MPQGDFSVALPPLDPGTRDRAVKIEQRSTADNVDTAGFPVEDNWTLLAEPVWMHRRDTRSQERYSGTAAITSAEFETRWTMPYRADMDPEGVDVPALRRLVHSGRVYNIHGASVVGRREAIELVTKARTSS